jgi:hypothetical protein
MKPNMSVYEEQVRELATLGVDFNVPNRSKEHAQILIEAIFDNAINEVRLFCGNLDNDFYKSPSLKDAIERFLNKQNTELRILTEKAVDESNELISLIHQKSNFTSLQLSSSLLRNDFEPFQHFAVMDRKGYRFEFSHDLTDASIVEAVANFNMPETAGKLADFFDSMWNSSKESGE